MRLACPSLATALADPLLPGQTQKEPTVNSDLPASAKHRLIKSDLRTMLADIGARDLCRLLAECCPDEYTCAVINKAASHLPAEKENKS